MKEKIPVLGKVTEGLPVVVLQDGKPIEHRMRRARIKESDILAAGRSMQGVERLEQMKYAVLEQSGSITVIPHRD